jgi:hypothetical protein
MVAVVSIFATLSEIAFKQLGVALASAVFVDATVVRVVLVPSAMKTLGWRNWYFRAQPRVLASLPAGTCLPDASSKRRRQTPLGSATGPLRS